MKNNKNIWFSPIMLLAAVVYLPVQAQQKNDIHRPSFSGEWKSKESISMGGNIVCTYEKGDRMLSKTMNITEQVGFLNITVPNPSPGALRATSVEKLNFDGKASEINYGPGRAKKFTAKLSADGKTITVNSTIHLMTATPYHIKVQEQLIVNVTEVWTLSNDGKSITVQTNAKSTDFGNARNWITVFYKAT